MLRLLKLFGTAHNEKLEELEPRSQRLTNISDNFNKLVKRRDISKKPLKVACFFERYSTVVRQKDIGVIVEKSSASFKGEDPIPVDNDHRGMCRFRDREEKGFKDAAGILRHWIKELHEPATESNIQVSR